MGNEQVIEIDNQKIIFIDNEQKNEYITEINTKSLNVQDAIEHIKKLKFQELKIFITNELYSDFLLRFKENINSISIIPNVVVLTKDKKKFEKNEKEKNNNNNFYNYIGTASTFKEIKKYIKNDILQKKLNEVNEVQLTFEYIDSKEKLILPLFFKALIDNSSNDNLEKYTTSLISSYSKNNKEIKNLLGDIESMTNIPIEILSKYYARLYSLESDFISDINNALRNNRVENNLPFIKVLYEGVKLKALPLASNNELYSAILLPNNEINKIKKFVKDKKKDLPGSIVFSKSFFSFTKQKNIAEQILIYEDDKDNYSKVLFILEKNDNIDYNLSTHCDLESLSFNPDKKEVLFFPFSSFEVKSIEEITIRKENVYEIKLLYLGKYLKDIENDKDLITNADKLPEDDYKKQLSEAGLIKKEKIETINNKKIIETFEQYKKDDNNNNTTDNIQKDIIIGKIKIEKKDINKDIQIINSYENSIKSRSKLSNKKDNSYYGNEKDIKDNIEIKINGQTIPFSYVYCFKEEGIYKIEYIFKKNLT